MPTARNTLSEAAESIKPYVERAMTDEQLRRDVMHAFSTARTLYGDLVGEKDHHPVTLASRVATDDDIRDRLRDAIEDLRSASERLQGKQTRARKGPSALLVAGIALGILFNPVTGPETRRFIRDLLSLDDEGHEAPSGDANGRG